MFQPKWALSTLFLAIIAGVPLLQLAVELQRGDRPGALGIFERQPTSANLRAFERSLEEDSVVAKQLRPWVQFAQFQWFRDGGEKGLIGRDGWLFYKPGFDSTVSRPKPRERKGPGVDPIAAIVAFRDSLSKRGIHLIVMPVPNKESVYPDKLTFRASDKRSLPSAAATNLLAQLTASRVEVVDLFQVFFQRREQAKETTEVPLYLAQDSHWSPAGINCAAKAVANRLIELEWSSKREGTYRELPMPVKRLGDIVQMFRVPQIERNAQPEAVACMQVVHADNASVYQDDPNAEILLIGDSFLRIFESDEPGSAGFVSHLAKELGVPLTSLVSDGGASTLVRQELFRRPALLKNKKVVIWEFVERDIELGTEGWQVVPLPPILP